MMLSKSRLLVLPLFVMMVLVCYPAAVIGPFFVVHAEDAGSNSDDDEAFYEFLSHCESGNLMKVQTAIENHPSWASRTDQGGESCLHAAGIDGQVEITKALLDAGADPNRISIMEDEGELHMSPLAWHVYSGSVDSARVLLQRGADPNLLVSSLTEPNVKVTVLDTIQGVLDQHENDLALDKNSDLDKDEIQKYTLMKQLLLEFGAKQHKGGNDNVVDPAEL